MSTIVQFKEKGFNESLRKLSKLAQNGKDITPIFNDFLDYFKKYIDDNWRKEGTPFGNPNKKLSPKYKLKKVMMGKADWADLQLSGKLKRAATGGDGWYQKVSSKQLEWGIDNTIVPYAMIHQYSGWTGRGHKSFMKQRPFWALKDGSMPGMVYQRFQQIIRFHMDKGVD